MRQRLLYYCVTYAMLGAILASMALGQSRRPPPQQWPADVVEAFFEDAREQLVGERPELLAPGEAGSDVSLAGDSAPAEASRAQSAWSALIDARTITDEVKRINQRLVAEVNNGSRFIAGRHLQVGRDFALLALLFRVIGEYDERIRWQEVAVRVSAEFYQVAALCREGSETSLQAAVSAHFLLDDLIRGQSPAQLEEVPEYESIAPTRGPVMQRMEQIFKEEVTVALADAGIFRKREDQLLHASQMLALLAEALRHPPFEDSEDDSYRKYAEETRDAAVALRASTNERSLDAARAAARRISESCNVCHAGYRG